MGACNINSLTLEGFCSVLIFKLTKVLGTKICFAFPWGFLPLSSTGSAMCVGGEPVTHKHNSTSVAVPFFPAVVQDIH